MLCNFGYARGRCCWFPEQAGADAHRFSAWQEEGGALRVVWIVEREFEPVAHGEFHYDRVQWGAETSGSIIELQAQAFARSWMSRTAVELR